MAKRDRARSERNILKAARQEFSRSGFDGARVEKIGARAKVSKGMIYHCAIRQMIVAIVWVCK